MISEDQGAASEPVRLGKPQRRYLLTPAKQWHGLKAFITAHSDIKFQGVREVSQVWAVGTAYNKALRERWPALQPSLDAGSQPRKAKFSKTTDRVSPFLWIKPLLAMLSHAPPAECQEFWSQTTVAELQVHLGVGFDSQAWTIGLPVELPVLEASAFFGLPLAYGGLLLDMWARLWHEAALAEPDATTAFCSCGLDTLAACLKTYVDDHARPPTPTDLVRLAASAHEASPVTEFGVKKRPTPTTPPSLHAGLKRPSLHAGSKRQRVHEPP